ncbi:hypothetical protein PoB_006909300 [Plakobranchus ocellatus]|uniref:Uncharacterized protein n=1 Tax=Plakobranchus ocellatus TaxID=259542 RepID=A0AAV4DE93_9GAST|nr:hypothetical protein PoB_006909300 [Plakobranchus ocellatus]
MSTTNHRGLSSASPDFTAKVASGTEECNTTKFRLRRVGSPGVRRAITGVMFMSAIRHSALFNSIYTLSSLTLDGQRHHMKYNHKTRDQWDFLGFPGVRPAGLPSSIQLHKTRLLGPGRNSSS